MKTILWDNDGVLVETEPLYYQASKEVLAEVGFHLSEDMFADVSLKQGKSVINLAMGTEPESDKWENLRQKRNQRYTELISKPVNMRKGIRDCLEGLKSKVKMGIVTSSLKEHFDQIHKSTQLLPYFDFVLTREGFNKPKPYPDAYLTALEKWNLKKPDCMVVEDSERGVIAAKAAGLKCVAIPHALSERGDFSGADYVCRDFGEVKKVILGWI
ncbi:hypothetical protein BVX98_04630 [bacterium F11]|nr:hypothetical protein BVX98_04630 [bacterium F11]